MNELDAKLQELARVPILLLACDYDGTLSPIVSDPRQAKPHREAIVALRQLASLPQTHVAVISGRALRDLAGLIGETEGIHLVGSHGSEFDLDFATNLPLEAALLREKLLSQLAEIAATNPGFIVEPKPASVAFHYRNASEADSQRALEAVLSGPAQLDGVFTRHGKKVVELTVVPTNKGSALETLRHRLGASAAAFIGDDVTDEDAFATLTGPDVGIKVGPGETRAPFRVDSPDEVARLLARLCDWRTEWLTGSAAVPIEKHSLLSDQRTCALVTPDARIVWLCLPRLDSPALFAELLGGPAAGHFTIKSADGDVPVRQRYYNNSLVLQTFWKNFKVTDFLDCSAGKPSQRAGRSELVRYIEGRERVIIEFAPRIEYGRGETHLVAREGGLLIQETHDPVVLRSPGVKWEIISEGQHHTARAEVELNEKPCVLTLCYGTGSLRESSTSATQRLKFTDQFWSSWASRLTLPPVETNLVRRSALTLKALCYGPTGGIAAASTTSLPEHLGGVRNWDYRYCWLRDGAMTASALVKLGSYTEGMEFLDWLLGVLSERSPERLQPLYTLTGEPLPPEAEIAELPGYAGSRPVRVGNGASRQVQLDVFGPIVDLIAQLIEKDAPLSSEHWRLVEAMVQAVAARWHEPDHGIWEIRRPGRHHTHSKLMCWLTVDRAVRIAYGFFERRPDDWIELRDTIAADLLQHGFNPQVNAFTAVYDSSDIDAATLQIGLSGFLPPDDARFIGTVEAVERVLRHGPTVYRYHYDDGLPGIEGGFHLCTSWLVDCYLLLGRIDDAWELFNSLVKLVGPTGLLSEQYDPHENRALGNHPQAYSHIGLIENAIRLSQVR